MSTSDRAYVWTWLRGSATPVVAGLVERHRAGALRFAYARSYLARPDAISLYGPELPLVGGWIEPAHGLTMASCLRDACPDAWGQRVIVNQIAGQMGLGAEVESLDQIAYMLRSGTNRFGAVDFQFDPDVYTPRRDTAPLSDMLAAVDDVEAGIELPAPISDALVHGTSIGGARPKILLHHGGDEFIAKLSTSTDPYGVVNAEAASLALARRAGIDVPDSRIESAAGRDILLVRRFDRRADGGRRHVVSGLTMLGLDEMLARYATYPDLLDTLRLHSAKAASVGPTLFTRIAFNIAIGNFDDHARNHAAFWDGDSLELTPAYDLCPQPRSGETALQAMAYGRGGQRDSNFATLISVHGEYGLTRSEAEQAVDRIVGTIADSWDEAADAARVTAADRRLLRGMQILNKSAFYGYRSTGS